MDYRKILVHYIVHVMGEEGTAFLGAEDAEAPYAYGPDGLSDDEREALQQAFRDAIETT